MEYQVNHENPNPKPSEVIYVFLNAIATVAVNLVRLTAECLWMLGNGAVKLVSRPAAEETESK
jgi:hypothetical protein